jgi:nitronate monooxygenase
MTGAPLAPYPVQNALTREIRTAATKAGNADLLSLWAGQGARLARELPAGELVAQIVRGLDDVLSKLKP